MFWACREETVSVSVEKAGVREIYGGSERGCGVSWCARRGCRGRGEMEADGWPWPPLAGESRRKRRRISKCHNGDLLCKLEHLPQHLGCIFLKGQAAVFQC